MSATSMVDVKHDGAVGIVRLARPERRNALGAVVVADLSKALSALDDDTAIRAIVLSGAPPGFCAGSDLKDLATLSTTDMVDEERTVAALARSIPTMSTPVVAAVEGFAIGGGCMLAVACDVVVTAASTRWHLSEVPLGWFPPWGMAPLIARVGPWKARHLVLSTAPVDGVEAGRMGLADIVVADTETESRAFEAAAELATLPAGAVASSKAFFAELLHAEALDRRASALFEQDVGSEASMHSLSRLRP